jgi:hypothetical protein
MPQDKRGNAAQLLPLGNPLIIDQGVQRADLVIILQQHHVMMPPARYQMVKDLSKRRFGESAGFPG